MKRLIASIIALGFCFVEVDGPNGFWTYLGGGILLLNLISVLKEEFYEQENF